MRLHLSAQNANRRRHLSVTINKGGHRPNHHILISLDSVRVDHAPPQEIANIAKRIVPGTPPKPPRRARTGARS
jgi:hypothetical protein